MTISGSEYKSILELFDLNDAILADVWNECQHFRWQIMVARNFQGIPTTCLSALMRAEFSNMCFFVSLIIQPRVSYSRHWYVKRDLLGVCCSFFSDHSFTKFAYFATRKQTATCQEDSVFDRFHYTAGLWRFRKVKVLDRIKKLCIHWFAKKRTFFPLIKMW